MYKKTTMTLAIATILTAYISTLTFSNQAFAQPAIGAGAGASTGALIGQSASNSGHVGQSGLLGQIQTHHMIASILRAQGHPITPTYIRNLLITAGIQHGYFVGSGAFLGQSASNSGHIGQSGLLGQNDGNLVNSGLGLNLLSSGKILVGHEAQLCKVLPLSRQFGITLPPPFFEEVAKAKAEIAATCAH